MSKKALAAALALAFLAAVCAEDKKPEKGTDYIKVEIRGTLRQGEPPPGFPLRSPGGGGLAGASNKDWMMRARGVFFPVDFAGNKQLREFAERHKGKTVIAAGTIEPRQYSGTRPGDLEFAEEPILVVSSLKLPAK